MAEFNPEFAPEPPQTNWVNASRGYDGGRMFSTLFGGVEKATNAILEAREDDTKKNIASAANAGVDQIVNAKPNQPIEIPETLKGQLETLDRYSAAKDQGVMSDLEFKVRLDKKAKEMRSQYGTQWGTVIDNALANAQGVSTANQLRVELQQAVQAERSKLDKKADDKIKFIEQNAEYIFNPSVLNQYELLTGTKYVPGADYNYPAMLASVGAMQAQEQQIKSRKAQVELFQSEDDYGQTLAKNDAQQTTNEVVSSVFNAQTNKFYGDYLTGAQKATADGVISPEEKLQLEASFNRFRTDAKLQVANLGSSLKNAKDREDLQKMLDEKLDVYQSALIDQNFGLFGAMARESSYIMDTAQTRLLKDDQFGSTATNYALFKKLGFSNDAIELAIQGFMPEGRKTGAQIMTGMLQNGLFGALVTNKASATELLSKAVEGGMSSKDALNQTLDAVVTKFVLDPKTTPAAASEAMKSFFAQPDNIEFIKEWGGKDPVTLFRKLASPQMTEKLKGTEIWGSYAQWVYGQFNDVVKNSAQTIISGQRGTDGVSVTFDGEKFSIKNSTSLFNNINPGLNPIGYVNNLNEVNSARQTVKAVADVNQYLELVKPIAKEDGADINSLLMSWFDGQSINEVTKEGSILTQMSKVVNDYLKAIVEESSKTANEERASQQ